MTMREKRIPVALASCLDYQAVHLADAVDRVVSSAGFRLSRGSVVLLKPNLVAAGSTNHLACTSAHFVAAVAQWFLDHGAKVRVGDSPAFGSARMVMKATGMTEALSHLDVKVVNFSRGIKTALPCGFSVPIAAEALDCDLLINLPKVKAHSQLYVSLAVKNYFGVVCGWRKALHHAVHGDIGNRFESLLADLPELFPGSFTIVDGITAMHKAGPMRGEPYPLGIVGATFDPVALDTALLEIIGADPERSILMQEHIRRGLPGTDLENITYPLRRPPELTVDDFQLPDTLKPVTFHPLRMAVSGCRRIVAGFNDR
ncbi:MAG: DUF362 domain-containing protein [Proteobacteria bacterium]|nr:DUF362 domain-containing protein [Pseudomonadota bacterium]MBU1737753.1 DUF362 domain-containing protein [Pseudomonadota bacterium]